MAFQQWVTFIRCLGERLIQYGRVWKGISLAGGTGLLLTPCHHNTLVLGQSNANYSQKHWESPFISKASAFALTLNRHEISSVNQCDITLFRRLNIVEVEHWGRMGCSFFHLSHSCVNVVVLCLVYFRHRVWVRRYGEMVWLQCPFSSGPGCGVRAICVACVMGEPWSSPACWLLCVSISPARLRTRCPRDGCGEGLLHVLRSPGDPTDTRHVPEPGRAHEHLCQVPLETHQKVLRHEEHRGFHGKHGHCGFLLLHGDTLHWSSSLFPVRGMELFPCLLLLLYNIDYHRVWRLCGPADQRGPSKEASLRGF